MIFYLKTFFIL